MPLYNIDDHFGDSRLPGATDPVVVSPSTSRWAQQGTCKDCTFPSIPSGFPAIDWTQVHGATILTTTADANQTEATLTTTFTGKCW